VSALVRSAIFHGSACQAVVGWVRPSAYRAAKPVAQPAREVLSNGLEGSEIEFVHFRLPIEREGFDRVGVS